MPTGMTRLARFPADAPAVARLVGDYLRQTEREKAEHGVAPGGAVRLPSRYQAEVDDPAAAFAGAVVLIAEVDGAVVGVAVLRARGRASAAEIKRLWVDPAFRRTGVGRLLLQECAERAAGAVRLSVWDWRTPAIRAYERLGFARVPSWESRERLVCMELPPPATEARPGGSQDEGRRGASVEG